MAEEGEGEECEEEEEEYEVGGCWSERRGWTMNLIIHHLLHQN